MKFLTQNPNLAFTFKELKNILNLKETLIDYIFNSRKKDNFLLACLIRLISERKIMTEHIKGELYVILWDDKLNTFNKDN